MHIVSIKSVASLRVRVIDSHTGGEPTRLVVSGGPDLGHGPLADRVARFRKEHDPFRSAVVNEPRGSDVMVGALLCEPVDPTCAAGVIFFNNVGYLGMCGHGTIGLVATLAYMKCIGPGEHRIETPVGVVSAVLQESGAVTVNNVASSCSSGIRIPQGRRPSPFEWTVWPPFPCRRTCNVLRPQEVLDEMEWRDARDHDGIQ